MRQQRSGHIINISSGAGRLGAPGMVAYHSAKWTVAGFTESIAEELGGFGVRAVAVKPDSMPTNWATSAAATTLFLLPGYELSVGRVIGVLKKLAGHEIGDLAKYGKAVFDLARSDDLPHHLILGSDALSAIRAAERPRQGCQGLGGYRSVDRSCRRESRLPGGRSPH